MRKPSPCQFFSVSHLELENQTFQISIPGLEMLEDLWISEHHTPLRDVIYGGTVDGSKSGKLTSWGW